MLRMFLMLVAVLVLMGCNAPPADACHHSARARTVEAHFRLSRPTLFGGCRHIEVHRARQVLRPLWWPNWSAGWHGPVIHRMRAQCVR